MHDEIIKTIGSKLLKQKPIVDEVSGDSLKKTSWNGYPVCYNDEKHVYFIIKDGVRYPLISVTTFYEMFKPKFDKEEMAIHCAQKPMYVTNLLDTKNWENLSVKERAEKIKKAWEYNSIEASLYGTVAHEALEYKAKNPSKNNEEVMTFIKQKYGKNHARIIIKSFLNDADSLFNDYMSSGYILVAEPILASPKTGIAGQTDLYAINHKTEKIALFDYKTNKENPKLKTGFGQLKGLLRNYMNTSWTLYCFQLATYANMLLSQYKDYEIERMTLLWLNPDEKKIEPLEIDLKWIKIVRNFFIYLRKHDVFKKAYQYVK